ncbi:MAG: ferritin-like domain-containing protein [Solirubrobacteraceae bacterium]
MSDTGPRPPASRRALLSGAGAALTGAGALIVAGCGGAAAGRQAATTVSPAIQQQDVEILTQALSLERRTVTAYVAGMPLLSHPQTRTARQFLEEELEHTGELISLIRAAGGKAGPRADSFELSHPRNSAQVFALLQSLEALQIRSYLGWIPKLSPGPVRAAVASILTVDSQHLSMLRLAQGETAVPGPFVTGAE